MSISVHRGSYWLITLSILLFSFSSFKNHFLPPSLSAEAFVLPHTICQSDGLGGAKVLALGGETPYTYLWDDGSTFPLNIALSAGLHTVTVTDALGVEVVASVEVIPANSNSLLELFTMDTFLCKGEFGIMEITNPYAEQPNWSSGDTTLSVIVAPEGDSTFYASADVLGDNYILNGDFELGDVLFSTDYTLGLGGAFGLLSNPGTYRITDDASSVHDNFPPCNDHSTGTGLMLIVNGSETPGDKIWCETVPVEVGQSYYFSTWVTMASNAPLANLQISINDVIVSDSYMPAADQCEWQQMSAIWSDVAVTEATICISNLNVSGPGNDFALDDIYFGPICTATDSITFELSDLEAEPEITIFPDCSDTTGAALVLPSGGSIPYTYNWDSGEVTPNASGLAPGVHRVTVTDADGCLALVGFIMPEPDYPTLDTLVPRATACGEDNGLIRISPTDGEGTPPFLFSIDGGDTFQQEPLFENLSPGEYNIVVEDAEGCELNQTVTIADSDPIETEIFSDLGTLICEIPELTLEVPGNYTRYRWSNGDSTTTLTVNEPGIYGVVVVDEDRCEAVDTIFIDVCNDYQIPNIFTPNGDNVNDLFGPVSRDAVRIIYLQIYNRWGELVYLGQEPWDGTFNGEPHPSDMLFFSMLLRNRDNEVFLEQGEINLIR